MGPAGIAEQDQAAAPGEAAQPPERAVRHRLLITDVARGDRLPKPLVADVAAPEKVAGQYLDRDPVERGIGGDRGGGEMIDLGGGDARGTDLGGGDRDEPGA